MITKFIKAAIIGAAAISVTGCIVYQPRNYPEDEVNYVRNRDVYCQYHNRYNCEHLIHDRSTASEIKRLNSRIDRLTQMIENDRVMVNRH